MKIFFDTEFTGLHQNTTLISIGLVAENDRNFYAEFTDYDKGQVDDWMTENVLNNLLYTSLAENGNRLFTEGAHTGLRGDKAFVRAYLDQWFISLGPGPHEMWSDVLAYDWMLFCQLWGHAFNIPETIYYIPFDLATLFKAKNINPDIDRDGFASSMIMGRKHNALWDAQIIKECYKKLSELT